MSTTASAPSDRAARPVLDRAVAAMRARRRAEVEVLEAALAWAHAHVAAPGEPGAAWDADAALTHGSPAALFGEQTVPIAGPGTPAVREFAPVELAAALDLSHEAALALLGDALDLAHRLTRLWRLVLDLKVPVHLARRAAQESRDLDLAAADHADRLLVWQPRRLNPHRVGVLVHEARLYADPDRAIADHDEALARRRVDVRHGEGVAPGTGEVFMVLDEADCLAFDGTVSTMATTMGALGHPGSLDVRRAHAVGLLADPQQALNLLAVADRDPADLADPTNDDPDLCAAEEAVYARPNPFRRPTTSSPGERPGARRSGTTEAVIVLHVTAADLAPDLAADHGLPGRGGVARSGQLGPVLMERLSGWLMYADRVTVKPVLDVTSLEPVDRHDPPGRMSEAIRFRDPTCVYPGCNRPSRQTDLDHIDPYVDLDESGPPGQTRPDNLAPLCRRHHRAKTHADFSYHRLPDGSYQWTLPTGLVITTDPPRRRPRPPR